MQLAWMPRWRRAQKCLRMRVRFNDEIRTIIPLPLTNEFKIDIARLEIPVSGWTCFNTTDNASVIVETRISVPDEHAQKAS